MQILFTSDDIQAALEDLAPKIVNDLGTDFTVIPILTGGFIFAADLSRALFNAGADPKIDFLQLSSYGAAQTSSGEVRLIKDLSISVENKSVLLIDDVLDSGRSLYRAKKMMQEAKATRVVTCVVVSKAIHRAEDIEADYAVFQVDGEAFLVGYGMDDAGARRAMPHISVMAR
ncbi:MAG: phosphoribosyltransferase family protein [Pseudomonadota bacterium]